MEPTRRIEHDGLPGNFKELEWDARSSAEVNRNSKGEVQYAIKVYDVDPDKAADKAVEIYRRFENLFGHLKEE